MPVTPYARDLRWETRHNQNIVVKLSVESNLVPLECCDIYAHYACVADCADGMADAWEDTSGCAHADCVHGNILKC